MDVRKRDGPKHGFGGKMDWRVKWKHVESRLGRVPSEAVHQSNPGTNHEEVVSMGEAGVWKAG